MEKNYLILNSIILNAENENSRSTRDSFLKKMIYDLLIKVGYNCELAPTPVEKIAKLFDIHMGEQQKLIAEGRIRNIEEEWYLDISSEQTIPFSGVSVLSQRGRFTLAHEIGHFLLYNILINFQDLAKKYSLDSNVSERISNIIAGELLVPSFVFHHITQEKIRNIMKNSPEKHAEFDFPDRILLNISTMEFLRMKLMVSRFVLIHQLHQSKLLEESQCAIIISFWGVNRNTGRSPALRVRYTAFPSWGFIPENTKLANLGIFSASQAFNDSELNKPRYWKDNIKVQERLSALPDSETAKWKQKIFESYGQHVAYSYAKNQRYLVSTLNWPHSQ